MLSVTFRIAQFLGLFLVSAITLLSCRCGGADRIYTNTGVDLMVTDSVNMHVDYDPLLSVTVQASRRDGDRKCYYKNLVTKTENTIPSSTVNIYCTRDIKLKTGTIPAHSNLLNNENLRIVNYRSTDANFEGCTIYPSYPDNSFERGMYTFHITAQGGDITFTDSATTLLY